MTMCILLRYLRPRPRKSRALHLGSWKNFGHWPPGYDFVTPVFPIRSWAELNATLQGFRTGLVPRDYLFIPHSLIWNPFDATFVVASQLGRPLRYFISTSDAIFNSNGTLTHLLSTEQIISSAALPAFLHLRVFTLILNICHFVLLTPKSLLNYWSLSTGIFQYKRNVVSVEAHHTIQKPKPASFAWWSRLAYPWLPLYIRYSCTTNS